MPLLMIVAVLGLALLTQGRAAAPPGLYVAPNGSDASSCTSANPCASFNRAYQLAQSGQTVWVAAGTYPDQSISPSSRSGAGSVVFRPIDGASVSTGEVRLNGASGLEFREMAMTDYYVAGGSSRITFRDIAAQFFFIRSATAVSIIGGSVGGEDEAISPTIGATYQSTVPSRDILVDGVTFHDITRAKAPADHLECLFVQSVDGLTVRNSRFHNCNIFDVYVNNIGIGPVPANLTFEDNFFDVATDGGYYSLYVRSDPGDVLANIALIHNSFAQGFHFDSGTYDGTSVVANVSPLGSCTVGISYSYNVFDRTTCGPTDKQAPLGFVNQAGFDLHLVRGAAALGLDKSHAGPVRDIDGDLRPLRAATDAGADQRETALIVPGRSIGAVRIGMPEAQVAAAYGPPRSVRATAYSRGAPRVTVATYRAHSGQLSIVYDGAVVVGVSTTSPYYTTAAGHGVGVPFAPTNGTWLACLGVYRQIVGGVTTDFATQGAQKFGRVVRASLLRRGYRDPGCQGAVR